MQAASKKQWKYSVKIMCEYICLSIKKKSSGVCFFFFLKWSLKFSALSLELRGSSVSLKQPWNPMGWDKGIILHPCGMKQAPVFSRLCRAEERADSDDHPATHRANNTGGPRLGGKLRPLRILLFPNHRGSRIRQKGTSEAAAVPFLSLPRREAG